jgi:vitamin B12 transporter
MKIPIITTFAIILAIASNAQTDSAKTDSIPKKVKQLGEVVVVAAGSFEASDKAKGASLTPMDAVTVAGTGGDIANALRYLPGAQHIGEREGLFVRGGSGEESKQFVDGTWLKSPNFSSIPGIPQYNRINPFLFKGILFSTGGYSALYGQAMSSALVLETIDFPDKSSASIHLFPQSVGGGWQQLSKDGNTSYGATMRYANMQVYNAVVPQRPGFFHGPEYMTADANFRTRTSKTGILKFYTNYGYGHTGMRNPDIDSSSLKSLFEVKNVNWYGNLSWRESLGKGWKADAAVAYNYSKDRVATALQNEANNSLWNKMVVVNGDFAQGRLVFTKGWFGNQAIRFGGEYFYSNDRVDSAGKLKDDLVALFTEADIRIARGLGARVGLRAEHSSLLNQTVLAPRLGLAYRLNDGGQINLAYGVFYQKPENIYLFQSDLLGLSRATHYIVNYQKRSGNRLLRVEAFYKQYKDLVTISPFVSNGGDGYAKGVELFWRDKKTFKDFDYWITYSFLDTKRKHLNYPFALQPEFAAPHTASIAIKRFFPNLNFSANLSYAIAAGRPYYNFQPGPGGHNLVNDQGTTNVYNTVNLSFAYLFNLFPKWKNKDFSGIGWGINNLFGSKPVFGYNYSQNGLNKVAVTLPATRSYYLGIFMTFGIDRRDDFINENL